MASSELKSIFPSLPRTVRGQPIVLGCDPKGKSFLYCNSKNVYIRDMEDPTKCDIYCEHTSVPNVAAWSPSGFYIASGDVKGNVRIWDTTQVEHILKNEFPIIGSVVKDIAWSNDSTKIAVGGEGREVFAKCINADMGTSLGELSGHTKSVNSVAFKPSRPFRIVTASEDFSTQFYEGPPFKMKHSNKEHGNFVNGVRYSPDGSVFITIGADKKVLAYDGKDNTFIGSFIDQSLKVPNKDCAHAGGVYALAFNKEGNEVLTVSADKTAKIWDVASRELRVTFTLGKDINDMQVGCLWSFDNIITVSLSGYINYLDRDNPSCPKRIQKGHNKPITCLTVTPDQTCIYSGASDGQIYAWNPADGTCELVAGKGHTNQVQCMDVSSDYLITVGMDDMCRYINMCTNEYEGQCCSLPSQPFKLSVMPSGVVVVACVNHIVVVDKGNVAFVEEVKWEPKCVSVNSNGKYVAIGGQHDVHIFELEGTALVGKHSLKIGDDTTNVSFSPDGTKLVVTSGSRRFTSLHDVTDNYTEIYKTTKQTGKIFSLAWAPDSKHFATGSLDGTIVIWCLETGMNKNIVHVIKDAHKKGNIHCLKWLSDSVLVSSGDDSCIKQWEIKLP